MLKARNLLDEKKKKIEAVLLNLVTQVRDAIDQAVVGLSSGNKSVCSSIVERDAEINKNRRTVENECMTAIALHQPVAHDLREIITASRIAEELERIGDYISDIASIVMQMDDVATSNIGLEKVLKMASLCTHMLDEVLAAYLKKDVEKAKKTAELDDEIDTEQNNLIEKLFSVMQSDTDLVPNASRMLWISHHLERCGDRATNIAEQVVFMLDAEVVDLD